MTLLNAWPWSEWITQIIRFSIIFLLSDLIIQGDTEELLMVKCFFPNNLLK